VATVDMYVDDVVYNDTLVDPKNLDETKKYFEIKSSRLEFF
jgi:hypothetical protein